MSATFACVDDAANERDSRNIFKTSVTSILLGVLCGKSV